MTKERDFGLGGSEIIEISKKRISSCAWIRRVKEWKRL
jgi:hypothetical protein